MPPAPGTCFRGTVEHLAGRNDRRMIVPFPFSTPGGSTFLTPGTENIRPADGASADLSNDLLAGKLCIASHHAAVCYMDGRFYLISYAANPTFLNNIQLKQNEEYALSDHDMIGLCGKICKGQKDPIGVYFIFRKI